MRKKGSSPTLWHSPTKQHNQQILFIIIIISVKMKLSDFVLFCVCLCCCWMFGVCAMHAAVKCMLNDFFLSNRPWLRLASPFIEHIYLLKVFFSIFTQTLAESVINERPLSMDLMFFLLCFAMIGGYFLRIVFKFANIWISVNDYGSVYDCIRHTKSVAHFS